jgi:Histidine phosphatase superfamily (branch 1)
MKKGGYVVVIRHGRTNESADTKDASPLDLSNCAGQLMLNEVGTKQAQAIGEAFKKAEVPVGEVIASTYCRAMETGRLAFGKAEPSDALLLEAFVSAPGTPVPPPWPQRVEMMKELIATAPAAGTNTVLITHFPNVKAALGVQIGFGDAAIVKPDGHGGVIVVARITAKEWAGY